jgi:hypothetical protein
VQNQYGTGPKGLVFGRSKPFASNGEMKRSITLAPSTTGAFTALRWYPVNMENVDAGSDG